MTERKHASTQVSDDSKATARASRVRTVPLLVSKEILAAVIALAAAAALSVLLDAPLEGPADPSGVPPLHVKAPWIFLGVQQALRFLPPLTAGVILPVAAVALIVLVAYLPGRTPFQRVTRAAILFGTLCLTLLLTLWGYLS